MLQPVIGLVVVALVFALVERVVPSHAPRRPWRARLRDVPWWFLHPPADAVGGLIALILVGVPLVVLGLATPGEPYRGFGPVAALPAVLQLPLALLLADGIGYLSHRFLFHGPLWRLHAVHHAPEELDWLSAARAHPLQEVIGRVLLAVPLVPLGFDPEVAAGAGPIIGLWALFLHTDVTWRFGPLQHLVATPHFHRWHHARTDGTGRNFAGLFPVLDRLGGTYEVPDEPAEHLGVADPVPSGVWEALRWGVARPRAR